MGKRISYTARCFSCKPSCTHIQIHAHHRRINITDEAGQGHSGSELSDTVAKVSRKRKINNLLNGKIHVAYSVRQL